MVCVGRHLPIRCRQSLPTGCLKNPTPTNLAIWFSRWFGQCCCCNNRCSSSFHLVWLLRMTVLDRKFWVNLVRSPDHREDMTNLRDGLVSINQEDSEFPAFNLKFNHWRSLLIITIFWVGTEEGIIFCLDNSVSRR